MSTLTPSLPLALTANLINRVFGKILLEEQEAYQQYQRYDIAYHATPEQVYLFALILKKAVFTVL